MSKRSIISLHWNCLSRPMFRETIFKTCSGTFTLRWSAPKDLCDFPSCRRNFLSFKRWIDSMNRSFSGSDNHQTYTLLLLFLLARD